MGTQFIRAHVRANRLARPSDQFFYAQHFFVYQNIDHVILAAMVCGRNNNLAWRAHIGGLANLETNLIKIHVIASSASWWSEAISNTRSPRRLEPPRDDK